MLERTMRVGLPAQLLRESHTDNPWCGESPVERRFQEWQQLQWPEESHLVSHGHGSKVYFPTDSRHGDN